MCLKDFKDFLKEYKVTGLAVAFIIAAAITTLANSLVNNIIMPIVTPFISKGGWQAATFNIGPIVIGWGAFAGALLNFLILAFTIFIIVKYVLREENVAKK